VLAKLRKATVSSVTSVSLCFYPSSRNISAPTGLIYINLNIEYFRKSIEKIQLALKSDNKQGYYT